MQREKNYFLRMDYDISKLAGQRKYQNQKKNVSKASETKSRSVYVYGKCDKSRNVRAIADRASHHRIRNIVRNTIARGELHDISSMPPSTSRLQRHTSRSWVTNLKGGNGHYHRKQVECIVSVPKSRDQDGNIVPTWNGPKHRFNTRSLTWNITNYNQTLSD